MLATLDRSTVVGWRDACALTLDWYMAGRSCEPGALNIRDVVEETAAVVDEHTGELLQLPALVITVRRSKTNPHGRLQRRRGQCRRNDGQLVAAAVPMPAPSQPGPCSPISTTSFNSSKIEKTTASDEDSHRDSRACRLLQPRSQ